MILKYNFVLFVEFKRSLSMEEVKRDIRAVLRLFHSGLDLGSLQFQYARLTGCKILREQLEFLLADCGDFVKIIT